MTVFRFRVADPMNPWFRGVEVEADDEAQAVRRAEHMLFARRHVGAGGVAITLVGDGNIGGGTIMSDTRLGGARDHTRYPT